MENGGENYESIEQKPVNFEIIRISENNSIVLKLSRNPKFGLEGKFGVEWQKASLANKKWFKAWDEAIHKTLDKYDEIDINGTGDGKENAEWKVTGLTEDHINSLESTIEDLAKHLFESYQ